MPITIPDGLPAKQTLHDERIFALEEDFASRQDIRPLKIAILNLMPKKIETETQILRLLSKSPLQLEIDFMRVSSHESTHVSQDHLVKFYDTFDAFRDKNYDGFIVTGAPVEHLDYEQVDYWDELCEVFEWSKTNVFSTIHICWGAQAGLYYHYGIQKYQLDKKMFGDFRHRNLKRKHPILKGFGDTFHCPHSRHTEVRREDVEKVDDLVILTESREAGLHMLADKSERNYYIFGHWEYDRDTLAREYFRDLDRKLKIDMPQHYFPNDDVTKTPNFDWACSANLAYANWLNYCVYQKTPYDLSELEKYKT